MYRVNNELPCLNQNTKLEVEDHDVLRKICSAELLFVSVTGRRNDIKTLLHLSAPARKSLIQQVTIMDARTSLVKLKKQIG